MNLTIQNPKKYIRWFVYSFIFIFISQIRLPYLPTSPLTMFAIMGILIVIYGLSHYKNIFNNIRYTKWIAFGYLSLILYEFLISLIVNDFSLISFIKDVPIVPKLSVFLIFYLVVLFCKNQFYFDNLCNLYTFILCCSVIWYLSTIFFPFLLDIHTTLYPLDVNAVSEYKVPAGLAGRPHLFGYHVAILWILLFSQLPFHGSIKKYVLIGLLVLCSLAIVIVAERSTFLGIFISVVLIFYYQPRFRTSFLFVISLCGLLLFGIIFSNYYQNAMQIEYYNKRGHLIERFQRMNLDDKIQGRLNMQIEGINIFFKEPLGLKILGKSWSDEIYSQMPWFFQGDRMLAIHNGFLGLFIRYGWFYAVIALFVLSKVIKISFQLVKAPNIKNKNDAYFVALGAAMIGNIVCSMFHNASFLNENSSIILFLMLTIGYQLFKDRFDQREETT